MCTRPYLKDQLSKEREEEVLAQSKILQETKAEGKKRREETVSALESVGPGRYRSPHDRVPFVLRW